MPAFSCNLDQVGDPLPHVWEHCVGSGHAALALRADWQQQLARCHRELGFKRVRFHGILSDDVGTFVRHAAQPVYSFFNADQIMDYLLGIGMRPFVELSFMPDALASGSETVFNYRGQVTPPSDYDEWATLIGKLVGHWAERYGRDEVRNWLFEVWNEPNLDAFWTGSQDDYFRLYRRAVGAIKEVDPSLPVGGPATAMSEWIEAFLAFCEREGLPVDFVSTHYYPTDAFGQSGTDTRAQLAHTSRQVMAERAAKSRRQAGDRPLYYTEWNSSSNPRDLLHDQPFAAAFAVKILMGVADSVDGYSFWTFSDIFEELYFPSVPFHGGFGLLNIHGIPKPSYRAFQLLHRLGHERLVVDGSHATVEVWAVRDGSRLTVLGINFALPEHDVHTELVEVRVMHAPEPSSAFVERIDEEHANPYRVWQEMGQPTYLGRHEVEQLQAASRLVKQPLAWQYDAQSIRLEIDLPPQAVAAISLELSGE